eukprot:Plantae.Rhodophyta-Hildenbrandia_rubra.ctg3115.p3 GENE.Plantae.Rhodophyta-Hildenbrandia_rubra.ctg3115~~Plantae.Rhodophyta-Hildenbrandia_rubra.ctg3115.p3  ORF type:complete len:160 (-),score=27.54 Plantae.Rhodophyta-Hildenbrandia_rubra.ctg3115:568-1047(-)
MCDMSSVLLQKSLGGKRKQEGARWSSWSRPELSLAQIRHAVSDAACSLAVCNSLIPKDDAADIDDSEALNAALEANDARRFNSLSDEALADLGDDEVVKHIKRVRASQGLTSSEKRRALEPLPRMQLPAASQSLFTPLLPMKKNRKMRELFLESLKDAC